MCVFEECYTWRGCADERIEDLRSGGLLARGRSTRSIRVKKAPSKHRSSNSNDLMKSRIFEKCSTDPLAPFRERKHVSSQLFLNIFFERISQFINWYKHFISNIRCGGFDIRINEGTSKQTPRIIDRDWPSDTEKGEVVTIVFVDYDLRHLSGGEVVEFRSERRGILFSKRE